MSQKRKSYTQRLKNQKNQKDQNTLDLAKQFTTALLIGTKRRAERELKQLEEQAIYALTRVGECDPKFAIPLTGRQAVQNTVWTSLWRDIYTVANNNRDIFTKEAIDRAFAKWKEGGGES
jgi:hypothetical protein